MTTGSKGPGASRGEAGRRGERIRSDLWVAVEPGGTGGIEIDLRSRVASYYGDAITRNNIDNQEAGS